MDEQKQPEVEDEAAPPAPAEGEEIRVEAEPREMPEGMGLKKLPKHILERIESNRLRQEVRQARATEAVPEAEHKRFLKRLRNMGLLIDRVTMRAWPMEQLEEYLALVKDGAAPGEAFDKVQPATAV